MMKDINKALKFYFITDHANPKHCAMDQVKAALAGGATMIQYRNKKFSPACFKEVAAIRDMCKSNRVPFIINDDILLAKAVSADGVHVGQDDHTPRTARGILGPTAIIGVSVSTLDELVKTDLTGCDYVGTGPVFQTGTKPDAKPVIGLPGLQAICRASSLPVVAIGGIGPANAKDCLTHGAVGIAVITAVSRSENPQKSAAALARICGCDATPRLSDPWSDEFGLIDKLLACPPDLAKKDSPLLVAPGDDAALIQPLKRPVITTDTQREGVHFSFAWQTPGEIGEKAVNVTLSDLAACYAKPLCLFVNLGLPPYPSDSLVEEIYAGMKTALAAHHCHLGGGNISGADQLSLDLFALGEGEDLFPLRKNARPGHGLYCTGHLGMAKAGLEILLQRRPPMKSLMDKFKFPRPRYDAARILADHHVLCVTDISDGLAGDAGHIAKASHISIVLDIAPDHLHPDLVAYCNSQLSEAMDMALSGGEDYELLFACPPEVFEQIVKQLPQAYPVGRCLPFAGDYILNPPKTRSSFQHGQKAM